METMEDKTGFNGLAEANFIRQQNAWQKAARDIRRDGHLMRDGIDAAADETTHGRGLHAAAPFDGFRTQGERRQIVDVRREEALLRAAKAEGISEFGLRDAAEPAMVGQNAVLRGDGLDGVLGTIAMRQVVSRVKAGTAQGSTVAGVAAFFTGGGETQVDEAAFQGSDDAEPEFGLALTDPALAGCGGKGRGQK